MKHFGIFLFFIFCNYWLLAQEPSYRKLTINEGLAQNQVVAFHQDNKGFVWLGTKAGLSRFDGLKFRNYYEEDGLPDSFISTISQAPDGKIYVLTRKGFAIFDGEKFTSYPVSDDVIFYKWRNSHLITTHLDDSRVFTHSSWDNMIFENGNYYSADSLFPGISEYEILWSWFSYDRKSFLFTDKERNQIFRFKNGEITGLKLNNDLILRYCPMPDGGVLIQYTDSILFFNQELRHLKTVSFNSDLHGIIQYIDEKERIYTRVAYNQIIIIENGQIVHQYDFDTPMITDVDMDNENNIWILGEKGAMYFKSENFLNYRWMHGIPDYTWSIVEEPGKGLWLATYGQGLIFFDGNNFNEVKVENLPEGGLRNAYYMGAIRDSKNRIWFPHSYGLVLVENGKASYQSYLPKEYALCAYEDEATGDLYFGQMNQITILRNNQMVEEYDLHPGNKNGIILSIISDKYNNIWIGNAYGISIWNGQKFTALPTDSLLFNKGAVSFTRDHLDNIWIGNKDGLYFYNYKDEIKKIDFHWEGHYVTDLQLVDNEGLFIGLIGGMAYLNLKSFYNEEKIHLDYYNHLNGFLGMEVLQNSSCATTDGKIWIAASDRITLFEPENMSIDHGFYPELIITKVSEPNENMEWEAIELSQKNKTLVLPHYRNHIRFDFLGITMTNPQNVRYAYRLKGFEESWSSPFPDRYVSFAYLPPGSYNFQVDVVDNNRVPSGAPLSFSFIISRPWWHQWWFVFLFIFSVIAVVAFFSVLIFNKVKQARYEKLLNQKYIAELKLEALKSQIDPHFIFNVLSSVGSSIYKGEKNEAYRNLNRFSRLIRQAFESNEKPYNSLESEIQFVKNYLELQHQRFKDSFDYNIDVAEEISGTAPVPRLLIQTLVENAVKHGIAPSKKSKFIYIGAKKENNHLKIIVEDNGVGRNYTSNNNNSTGKGLAIVRELFDIFNVYNQEKIRFQILDLFHKDNSSAGTRVEVDIPVNFDFEVFDGKTENYQ